MTTFNDKPWPGPDKLVIAIDIGATSSAVSYAHLCKGRSQSITRVGLWPGLPKSKGLFKTPSLVYYDNQHKATAIGAEALSPEARREAETHHWELAQNFKINLHPEELQFRHGLHANKLPDGVSLKQIYIDFLSYLLGHTEAFFKAREIDGGEVWDDLIGLADIVIAHPNAWGLVEQTFLREVAVAVEIVDAEDANERIHFVTESEASLHFCISRAGLDKKLQAGTRLVVCDAGGSTIDTTAYSVDSCEPNLVLREARGSGCVQAGGIFVNEQAKERLRSKLTSPSADQATVNDRVDAALDDFEYNLKPKFDQSTTDPSLAVDQKRCNDETVGIVKGRLTLETKTVASFFNPSVLQVRATLQNQLHNLDAQYLLLVGGYGESPYLQAKLKDLFKSGRPQLVLLDDGTAKAVSDGAIIWKCNRRVRGRVARRSYGIAIAHAYDPENDRHKGRRHVRWLDGIERVPNGWKPLVEKGDTVHDDTLAPFMRQYPSVEQAKKELAHYSLEIWAFDGVPEGRPFLRAPDGTPAEGFELVCKISTDLSSLANSSERITHPDKSTYHKVTFSVGITFGDTEMSAYIQWIESGVEKRGRAELLPQSTSLEP